MWEKIKNFLRVLKEKMKIESEKPYYVGASVIGFAIGFVLGFFLF